MRKFIVSSLILLSLAGSGAALARDKNPYITARELDLATLLAPPPAIDSAQMKQDLLDVLELQVTRTPEMIAHAKADRARDVWRFADVMGPEFEPERLPAVARFFARLVDTERAVVDPAKDKWKRPRPFLYSDLVKPALKLTKSGSYPSGHSTDAALMSIVLSNMVPEKRTEIMARAADYAHNRVVAGMHFPSDVEAGRIAGTVIAARLQTRDDFQREFAAARKELRSVMGLGEEKFIGER